MCKPIEMIREKEGLKPGEMVTDKNESALRNILLSMDIDSCP